MVLDSRFHGNDMKYESPNKVSARLCSQFIIAAIVCSADRLACCKTAVSWAASLKDNFKEIKMKTNRNKGVIALVLGVLLFWGVVPHEAQAQTPQQQTEQPRQLTPLVTATAKDGDNPRTVWELVVPHRPDDRATKLSLRRVQYGFSLIAEDPEKTKDFIQSYLQEVKPGPNAWEKVEELVLLYTNGRAQADQVQESELDPKQVRIINKPEEIKLYYGLDPDKDFRSMDWGLDPMGVGVVAARSDILKNIENYERKIDQLYSLNPAAGKAIKQAARACIATPGNTPTCFDAHMKDIVFLQRNHGRTTVGENESYLKGTNRPNAHGTFFFVPGIGWKGIGWECFDNPLEPFTVFDLNAEVNVTQSVEKPAQAVCEISVGIKLVDPKVPLEEFPDQTVMITGRALIEDASKLQLKSEWLINDQLQVTNPYFSGSEEFPFGPKVTNFQTGTYNGMFRLTDQLGRVSGCTFIGQVNKRIPPPPPTTVTLASPPTPEHRVEKHHKKWPWIVAAIGAGGLAGFFGTRGGHHQAASPTVLVKPPVPVGTVVP